MAQLVVCALSSKWNGRFDTYRRVLGSMTADGYPVRPTLQDGRRTRGEEVAVSTAARNRLGGRLGKRGFGPTLDAI
jgi:hypothetical protein